MSDFSATPPMPDAKTHMINWLFYGLLVGLIPNVLLWVVILLFQSAFDIPDDKARYLLMLTIGIAILSVLLPATFALGSANIANAILYQRPVDLSTLTITIRLLQGVIILAILSLIIAPLVFVFGTELGRLIILPFFCALSSVIFTVIAGNSFLSKVRVWLEDHAQQQFGETQPMP